MDVRCTRCATDYEFDDALISERGTTVKCTNCGFQFKIFPPSSAVSAPERWVVRTMTGHEVVFTSLRDLQRGISERKVGPNDLLSRGSQPARPLGAIPELEPFFVRDGGGPGRGFQSVPRTLHGVAPPPSGAPRPQQKEERPTGRGIGQGVVAKPNAPGLSSTQRVETAPGTGFEQRAPSRLPLGEMASPEPIPDWPDEPPPPPPPPKPERGVESTSPPKTASVEQNLSGSTVRLEGPARSFDTTLPAATQPMGGPAAAAPPAVRPAIGSPPAAPPATAFAATAASATPPTAPASAPRGQTPAPVRAAMGSQPSIVSSPSSSRDRFPSYDESSLHGIEPARRARSRWIAGIVVLGVVGLLGLTVGRQYIARFTSGTAPEAGARDERASRFLAEGTRLLDQADYEGAKEQLVKAQALADRDPAVLAQLARLETLRADLSWLKLRLLDPTSTALVQATHRELGQRVGRASKAVDAAFAVAPEDPTVVRARVDALRLSGEEKKAREWIAPIAAAPSDPQNAYVLAALDLAESAPAWDTVIDRLRSAAVSEREATRARSALVYALVRAGRGAEAESELAKLAGGERPHPLREELTEFVARFKSPVDAGSDAAPTADAAPLDPRALPALDTTPKPDEKPSAEAKPPAGDFRTRLADASRALSAGNLATAEALYQSVVSEQPGNTEALAGLADVARKRGDSSGASRLYAKVLEKNPSYLPALMASADAKWEAGDRKGAIVLYQRIVEQAGGSTDYGRRAQARIAQGEGEKGGDGASSESSSPSTSPAPDSGTTPSDDPPVRLQ